MIDAETSLAFSVFENPGVYALLVGSGVSRAAQIPTGWEITLDLVRRVAALQGVKDEADWAAWYRGKAGKDASYSDLLDQLSATPDERRSILHSYIEPTSEEAEEGRKVPTRAHRSIAKLVKDGFLRVIITTNFDRLIENALREVGVEPTVIASDDALKGAVPLIHSRCYVVKVHGDYLDTRIRNTEGELSGYSSELNGLLDRIIDEHGLIVCGWSGDWDHALREAIERAPNRRYPLFWASRGAPSAIAGDLVAHRAGKLIAIEDADQFFGKLEQRVTIQAESRRPDPRSVELLVASTKKFLRGPEYRIQLDELVGGEFRELLARLKGAEFGTNGEWPKAFIEQVSQYEAATEALGRIFGVLGCWGTGAEVSLAHECIKASGTNRIGSGLEVLVKLQSYPGVLLFYSYGMGLLHAGRYGDLFRLFNEQLRTSSLVYSFSQRFFPFVWSGSEQASWWRTMPGLERNKLPLNDHLYGLLRGWVADYLFIEERYTVLFEEFELLGALSYLALSADFDEVKKTLDAREFVWIPPGRACCDSEIRERIFADWDSEQKEQALLAAGFSRNDREFLKLAKKNVERVASHIRFW
ncbi:hypothetical protein GJ689_21505 [Rhodoplanes serenus]|uniref:Deacetylase sirtuin-type domain-containing protein n=1 Tax=Rhodoplanes serenus TaxID=200615 RepID=A0A9X5ATU8_9BRAD|nr:SIR2 family protein [Rhodoplanes serenus]MTW18781.1 hypothetical protein [Rhodoplanes serenus]